MLKMFRFKDANGAKFNILDLTGVHHEHCRARVRKFIPIVLSVKRRVRCSPAAKAAGKSGADVHEIPVNLIIDRQLRSEASTQEMLSNQAGKVLTKPQMKVNGMPSELLMSCPEVCRGNARCCNSNGRLMRESPHMGLDGIVGKDCPDGCMRKVYVNDVALVPIDGLLLTQPVRVLSYAYHGAHGAMMASVRRFRLAGDVDDEIG